MKYLILTLIVIFLADSFESFGQKLLLSTVYFKNNSDKIDPKYESLLRKISLKAESDSCGLIRILGYADTTESEEYNDILSKNRASHVYKFFFSDTQLVRAKIIVDWNGESDKWYDLHL